MRRLLLRLLPCALLLATPAAATWSIVAVHLGTHEVAVGCATCIQHANLVRGLPVVRPGLGVANFQSSGDVGGLRKPLVWEGLAAHRTPEEILHDVRELPWFQNLQLGIVSFDGAPVTFSGSGAGAAVCGLAGQEGDLVYAVQGNLMTGEAVCTAARDALLHTDGDLATRMMAAMQAARALGGDGRCSCARPDPTSCGAPPPTFAKAAHSGFLIVSRVGDPEGVCEPVDGCAQGDYYFIRNVLGDPDDPDPVEVLQVKFDAWRAKESGRPDQIRSEVLVDRQLVLADGADVAHAAVVLRDLDGVQLPAGGASVWVERDPASDPCAEPGPVTDLGDGTYAFDLRATRTPGRAAFRVWVDFAAGQAPRRLWPDVTLEARSGTDLLAGRYDVSAADPRPVPFLVDRGPGDGGRPYRLLGTASGTVPGFELQGVTVPLNRDRFLELVWREAGSAGWRGFVGRLDAEGRARAVLDLPRGAWGALVGERLDFCAVLLGPPAAVTAVAGLQVIR